MVDYGCDFCPKVLVLTQAQLPPKSRIAILKRKKGNEVKARLKRASLKKLQVGPKRRDYTHLEERVEDYKLKAEVVGRKNYYGSGSIRAAELAALMFSLFNTLLPWNINPNLWLEQFFNLCTVDER